MSDSPNREWIREFAPAAPDDASHVDLVREIVIREHAGHYFDLYLTHPGRRLLTHLTLDECLGYVALAIVNGRPSRWDTLDFQRDWDARYRPSARVLEPWEKQLPERAGS